MQKGTNFHRSWALSPVRDWRLILNRASYPLQEQPPMRSEINALWLIIIISLVHVSLFPKFSNFREINIKKIWKFQPRTSMQCPSAETLSGPQMHAVWYYKAENVMLQGKMLTVTCMSFVSQFYTKGFSWILEIWERK